MKEHVISTEAHEVCEVEKSLTKQTDVSTEFILSVVEGLDMTARFVTNKQINKSTNKQ